MVWSLISDIIDDDQLAARAWTLPAGLDTGHTLVGRAGRGTNLNREGCRRVLV